MGWAGVTRGHCHFLLPEVPGERVKQQCKAESAAWRGERRRWRRRRKWSVEAEGRSHAGFINLLPTNYPPPDLQKTARLAPCLQPSAKTLGFSFLLRCLAAAVASVTSQRADVHSCLTCRGSTLWNAGTMNSSQWGTFQLFSSSVPAKCFPKSGISFQQFQQF